MEIRRSLLATLAAIVLPALAVVGPASAASSAWEDLGGGKARLVASLDPATSQVTGVVEFVLNDGWKTYWREPGGSGIPPQFDFSGSRHFAFGPVAFPVPEHVVLPGSSFVGYRGRVMFVFEGMATDLAPDGLIRLNLLAGVCEEICIPATAEFEIGMREMMVSDPDAEQAIQEAGLALPAGPGEGFRVESARVEGDRLAITATVPDAQGDAALFVEGPARWQLLPAKPAGREGHSVRFLLDLSRMPAGEDPASAELTFTLTSGGAGIEQSMRAEPARR
ncbi:MAG: protein-disulfide reductase DsbD domain-containing protein [Pseudomonadota bacterium]|nr:protein-disulfide reductase DsbD domain-containing protein [Pseudomonadota bacterium]